MEKEKLLTEYYHLAYAILGNIAVVIAFFLIGNIEYYPLIFAGFNILYLTLVIAWLFIKSRSEISKKSESEYKQNRFVNFWKNNLSPNEKEEELTLIPKIVIIDHLSNKEKIFKDINDNQKLLTEANKFTQNLIPVFSNNYVLVRRWDCKDDEVHERVNLKQMLEGAKAVIFSRTKGLEKEWFYEILNEWAKEHSEFPCLYVDKLNEKDKKELEKSGGLSKIPPYFNKITDDSSHLPWKFLLKANQRSANWRKQATYNRFVGLLFFTLFIMSLIFLFISGIVLIVQYTANQRQSTETNRKEIETNQKERDKIVSDLIENPRNGASKLLQKRLNDDYAKLKNTYENKESSLEEIKKDWLTLVKTTRSEYLNSYTDISNINDLQVSYWVRSNKDIQVFVTTEVGNPKDSWDFNKSSAIGCSFVLQNRHTQWDEKNDMMVFNFKGQPEGKQGCDIGPRENKPIQSIVCTAINENNNPEKYTVGICAFALTNDKNTSSKANIFLNEYRDFLRDQTQRFYDIAKPLIEQNKIIPLITNKEGKLESIKGNE